MRMFLNWLFGDWWKPVQDDRTKTWGIYHPTRWHYWGYGLTFEEARVECYRRNLTIS